MKRVLDIGNCGPDHASLTRFFLKHFGAEVAQANLAADALAKLKEQSFDLAVVNRKLDADYSDGIEVIKQLKADPATAELPVMLITNYPEHQDAAEKVGALRGFGKLELEKPETVERCRAVLG
ncbi:Transcriptional regulatory protein ZraR [Pirellulimonas nuda]|uniref:Transcriptional regulatory protein ZraR n=1 Tax=Pirellulimonas nuda TaxID=2528009 RepID=A0A518D6B0_9BACT|nr:response regulator [Pirellulimonas nuda]QDU87008.1 Transcriptional regulatory protein ZraR [Pirellulimonas nuda]